MRQTPIHRLYECALDAVHSTRAHLRLRANKRIKENNNIWLELVWFGLLLCFVYTFFYNVVVLIHLLIRWLVRTDTVQWECFLLFVFLLLMSIVKIKISNCLLHSFSSFNEIYSGQNDRLFLMCQFKLCPFLQISHGCCSIHSCIYHWRNHGNGWFLVWYGQHL